MRRSFPAPPTHVPSTHHHPIITSLFTVPVRVPFPECHTVGITVVDCSDWLLSLNNMHLSFFYVFSRLDSSFPLVLNIVWMDCNLFICSSTEGHLGCFQIWTIMGKAAEDISLQFFVYS